MSRVFSAIDLSPEVREALAAVQTELDDGFKPVDPGQMHVTLQFFADIMSAEIEEIQTAMDAVDVSPFEATVRGLGAFPSQDYISVVWAGVDAPELDAVYEQVSDHTVPDDDDHDFRPHVTLLRARSISPAQKKRLQQQLREHAETVFGSFTVDAFTLYESERGPDGPTYSVLHRASL